MPAAIRLPPLSLCAANRGRPRSRRRDSAEKAPPAPGSWSRNSGRRLSRPLRRRHRRCRRGARARLSPRSRSPTAGVSRPGRLRARAVSGAGAGPAGPGLREVGLRRTAGGGRASPGWHEPAAGPGRGNRGRAAAASFGLRLLLRLRFGARCARPASLGWRATAE